VNKDVKRDERANDGMLMDNFTIGWLFPNGALAFVGNFYMRHDGRLGSWIDPKIACIDGDYFNIDRTAKTRRRGKSRRG